MKNKATNPVIEKGEPIPVEPNWKEIAYELASIIDDIDLDFQIINNPMQSNYSHPNSRFLIKRFIAAQKYFKRLDNEVLYIDDYNVKKENDRNMLSNLMRK